VYQHGAYLPNLGTADAEAMRKSIVNLSTHLQISNAIGGQGVIFHVGSPKKGDRNQALKRAVVAMKQILKSVRGDAQLIMENSGSVKKIGGSIEDLQYLFTQVNDSRLKVCVDTAHSFEAGLIEDYTPVKIKKFLDDWDEAIGLNNIPALHINDSKTQYNSQNDKHENLGEGYIGLSGFKNLAKEKRLAHTSWFLEVPGFPAEGGSASGGAGPDKKNMELLKSCFSK